MADATLELEVILENGQFKVESKEVKDGIKQTGEATKKAGEQGQKGFAKLTGGMKAFATAAKATVILALVAGFAKLVKTSLKSAAAMEQNRIAFATMLKSGEKADKLLKDITKFAASTPFQLPGLIEASKRLLAFGVAQEDMIITLQNLGNAAGGNAEKLDRLTLAYGKLKAKGKASLEEINMFTEAGVPLMEALSEQYGVTTGEMFKMISKGKVGFKEVNEAITTLTTGTGKFAGLLEKQSQSLGGMFSTLKDKLGLLALDMGQKLSPAMKNLVGAFLDGTDSGGVFTQILTNIAWVLGKIVNGVALLIRSMNFLITNIELGLIKVKKIRFEIANGVSEQLIKQNENNVAYAEYIKLLDREKELQSESRSRGNAVIKQAEELLGLNKENLKVKKEAIEAEKRIKTRNQGEGGVKGGGVTDKDKEKEQKDFDERMGRLKKWHGVELSEEEQKELKKTEIARAEQRKAAVEYEAYLNTKLGLDSVYWQGVQTVAQTASVFMAQENKKLFRFGQALAISQAWINTFLGMTKAYAQLGPIGGAIGAGVIFTAGVLQTKKIAQQKPPEFATGSFSVPETSPAIVHKGEMIIPKTFADSVRKGEASVSGGAGGMRPINVQIDGETLFTINEGYRDDAAQNQGSPGSFPQESAY